MIVSYPSSGNEIFTETPLEARSIKSLWLFYKQQGKDDCIGAFDAVSVSVDDVEIMRNLCIYPYVGQISGNANSDIQGVCLDRRLVQINANINVNHSELRISGLPANKYALVVEYSEDIAEVETYDFIENTVFRLNNTTVPTIGNIKPVIVTGSDAHNVNLDSNPHKIFATSLVQSGNLWKPFIGDESIEIELLSSNEIVPRGFEFKLIDTARNNLNDINNRAWRTTAYTFDNVADRNIGVRFTNRGVEARDVVLSFVYKKTKA